MFPSEAVIIFSSIFTCISINFGFCSNISASSCSLINTEISEPFRIKLRFQSSDGVKKCHDYECSSPSNKSVQTSTILSEPPQFLKRISLNIFSSNAAVDDLHTFRVITSFDEGVTFFNTNFSLLCAEDKAESTTANYSYITFDCEGNFCLPIFKNCSYVTRISSYEKNNSEMCTPISLCLCLESVESEAVEKFSLLLFILPATLLFLLTCLVFVLGVVGCKGKGSRQSCPELTVEPAVRLLDYKENDVINLTDHRELVKFQRNNLVEAAN